MEGDGGVGGWGTGERGWVGGVEGGGEGQRDITSHKPTQITHF